MSDSETRDLTPHFERSHGWFSRPGADSDVVISSRVRVARNVAGFPFPAAMTDEKQAEFEGTVIPVLDTVCDSGLFQRIELDCAEEKERGQLRERNVLAETESDARPHLLYQRDGGALSVVVNARDHLRIAALHSGRALRAAWDDAHQCETTLAKHLRFSVNMEFGYLTREIGQCGTGVRAGVLLHLPGLVSSQGLSSASESVLGDRFRLKGFGLTHGDRGADELPFSHVYQVSDRYSLGRSEEEQISELEDVLAELVGLERAGREYMLSEYEDVVQEAIGHAWDTLTSATELSADYAVSQLLTLRFAVASGYITALDYATLTSLLFVVQKWHILAIGDLYGEKVDVVRANLVRQILDRNLKQRG